MLIRRIKDNTVTSSSGGIKDRFLSYSSKSASMSDRFANWKFLETFDPEAAVATFVWTDNCNIAVAAGYLIC